ncbi:hypothetical protein CVIRNUC_001477 [Coccomyxa viridis]|uniref:Nodulin-like domain-containing protein n=1 Tax=Coccomyxa viridis TaxID=1274662 RepID=A0AAV1HU56_9CHLO|nr:hypothetical protein CVIRNUC_001477 [Coccomyxa viridis]
MKRVQDRLDRGSFSILTEVVPPVRLASVDKMYINKWYSLVAAIFLQLMGGLCYTFSLYSSSLKTALNVDQPSLEFIASCLLSGGYFSWIPGLAYDALRHRHKFAPRFIAAGGCAVHFVGYFAVWATAKGIVQMPFWLLAAFALCGSAAVVFFDAAAIVCSMRNFPTERGNTAGTLKSFLGLSASLMSTIYVAAFQPDGLSFLLFVACLPVVVGFATIPFLNQVPYLEACEIEDQHQYMTTGKRFGVLYGAVGFIVVYQLVTAVVTETAGLSHGQSLGVMIGVLVLLATVVLAPFGSGGVISRSAHEHSRHSSGPPDNHCSSREEEGRDGNAERGALLSNGSGGAGTQNGQSQLGRQQSLKPGTAMPELTLPQCLVTVNFWILWSALCVGMGAGFTMLNNLAQIVEALGGDRQAQGVYVLLFTTVNTLGRMTGGYLPEKLLHARGTPRTIFAPVASAMTCVVALLSAFTNLRWLLGCAITFGFVFGWHWSLMPVLTSELFGLQHFASNHALMHLAPTIGGLLMSATLAGNVYSSRGRAHNDPMGSCFGGDCYRASFLVIAGIAAAQTIASAWLYLRTRAAYKTEYMMLKKFAEEVHGNPEE